MGCLAILLLQLSYCLFTFGRVSVCSIEIHLKLYFPNYDAVVTWAHTDAHADVRFGHVPLYFGAFLRLFRFLSSFPWVVFGWWVMCCLDFGTIYYVFGFSADVLGMGSLLSVISVALEDKGLCFSSTSRVVCDRVSPWANESGGFSSVFFALVPMCFGVGYFGASSALVASPVLLFIFCCFGLCGRWVVFGDAGGLSCRFFCYSVFFGVCC